MTPTIADARAALARGQLQHCAQIAAAAIGRDPGNGEAHFLLAMALAESGQVAQALQSLERATAVTPNEPEYLAQFARLLTLARREADARAAADRAAILSEHADPRTLDTIGCVYARLADHGAALPLFERVVALEPDNNAYRFNLASTYGFFGRIDDAEAQYEAIIAREPGHGRAHLGLASLRRLTAQHNHVDRLEAALTTTRDPVERLRIHYAAAKEHEDLGDHAAVFHHLSTGNAAHKQRIGFNIASEQGIFRAIEARFSDPSYFRGPSNVADAPIFVTGLPRTGTTLVDRILSSHRDVESAGELQAMPLAIKRLSQSQSRLILDPDTVARAVQVPPDAVGRDYMTRARQHAGTGNERFVDKLPLNFLYIGYIAASLPNARIVCLRRHPMDSVWSNFKNLFATSSSYYAWSYDLMDTARYYLLFDRLMAFWQTRFPGRVLELGYEALIADQEGQTRRLLDHCGLDWDPACLTFQNNAAPVATPSAQQVRRPMNSSAVGRWRNYDAWLGDVRALFAANGISTN